VLDGDLSMVGIPAEIVSAAALDGPYTRSAMPARRLTHKVIDPLSPPAGEPFPRHWRHPTHLAGPRTAPAPPPPSAPATAAGRR
jgi:hypothetical protein